MTTPGEGGAPRSVGEDPAGAADETQSFVLDAFEQLTNDGDQYELPEVHQPPVSEEVVAPAAAPLVPTPPQGGEPPVQQVQATPAPAQPVAAPPQPGAAEQTGVVQQAPQAVPPQQVAQQAPPPQPQTAAQALTQVPAVQQAPSGPQAGDFSAIAEGLKASEKIFTQRLAETEYSLTKEEMDALGFDATQAAAVSALAAKTHVNAVGTVLRTIAQQMPAMMGRYLQVQNAAKSAEDSFYGQWPQLKEHSQTVLQLGQAYRNAHPRASQEDFIKMVGAMSVTALGLHVGTPPTQPQAVPQVSTPGRVVRPQGAPAFQPAGAANSPMVNGQVQQAPNPWEAATSFIQDDDSGIFDR